MGIGAAIAGVAGLASTASAVSGLVNSGGSSTPATGVNPSGGAPGTYIPQAQYQADQYLQGIYANQNNYATALPGQTIPGFQTYAGNIQNNPYAAQAQTGANTAAASGGTAAGIEGAGANNLYGAATSILNTGFDPQTQLYNQQVQQLQDQFGASNAMAGLSGSAAAGVENQGLTNFNLGWENQQLGRESTALGAADTAYTGAGNLANLGYTTQASSSSLPYSTYLGQQNQDIASLQALQSGTTNAFTPEDNLANLLNSYLGLGQSATAQAQYGQNQAFGQNQQLGQQLGSSLSGLSNLANTIFAPSPNPAPVYGSGATDLTSTPYSDFTQYQDLSSLSDSYGSVSPY